MKAPSKEWRVALYARVSSDKQAHEGTIESQVAVLRERIEADGCVLEPELCFIDDGVSGSTLVRPALERLRDHVAAGAVERLYVLAPDRLARRHAHQMVLVEELQSQGIDIVFLNRPVGTTPEDQLLLQVQGIIAEYERAKILERMRRGRLHAARCGRLSVFGQAPFGYRYIDKHSGGGLAAYEVIEEEAAVVRQIFAWVGRNGCTLRDVVRRLEKMGVRTRHGSSRWNRVTVWGMLRNPAYQGQATFGRTRTGEARPRLRPRRGQPEIPKRRPQSSYDQPVSEHIRIPVPALVDADLFAAVQERLAENRQRVRATQNSGRYLLSGLAVCGCCGYAICGQAANGRPYYRCLGRDPYRFGGQAICRNPSQQAAPLEAAVWDDVRQLLSEPDRLRQEFERRQQRPASDIASAERTNIHSAMAKAKQGISRLIDAYAAGLMEACEFEPRIRRLKDRVKKFETELQTLDERAQHEEDLRLVFSRFEDFAEQMKTGLHAADRVRQREILRALIKRVEVNPENLRIVYRVPAHPFAKGPSRGPVQDCLRRQRAATADTNGLVCPGGDFHHEVLCTRTGPRR